MALHNFDKCIKIVLEHEGGFVNHPRDPGGATNMGITKKTYEDYTGRQVNVQAIRDLKEDDVTPIYKSKYWGRVSAEALPKGVDMMVFDFAVNSGTSRASKFLQKIVGAGVDGNIGPITLRKVDEYVEKHGSYKLIREIREARVEFLKGLSTFDVFGKGWMRRVEKTTAYSTAML